MKIFIPITAFLAGAILASAVWGIFLVRCQIEMATHCLTNADIEARNGQKILSYMDSPNPEITRRVMLSASNHIVFFPAEVDEWDKRYPYMDIKKRFASTCEEFRAYLQERQVKLGTNAPIDRPQPNTALEPTGDSAGSSASRSSSSVAGGSAFGR